MDSIIMLSELKSNLDEIIKDKRKYYDSLSDIDQELEDLKHFAEFNNLSASQGYKWYKLFHDKMVKRREIKNMISEISALESLRQKTCRTNDTLKQIKEKTYKPRKLNEIFQNGRL